MRQMCRIMQKYDDIFHLYSPADETQNPNFSYYYPQSDQYEIFIQKDSLTTIKLRFEDSILNFNTEEKKNMRV